MYQPHTHTIIFIQKHKRHIYGEKKKMEDMHSFPKRFSDWVCFSCLKCGRCVFWKWINILFSLALNTWPLSIYSQLIKIDMREICGMQMILCVPNLLFHTKRGENQTKSTPILEAFIHDTLHIIIRLNAIDTGWPTPLM